MATRHSLTHHVCCVCHYQALTRCNFCIQFCRPIPQRVYLVGPTAKTADLYASGHLFMPPFSHQHHMLRQNGRSFRVSPYPTPGAFASVLHSLARAFSYRRQARVLYYMGRCHFAHLDVDVGLKCCRCHFRHLIMLNSRWQESVCKTITAMGVALLMLSLFILKETRPTPSDRPRGK